VYAVNVFLYEYNDGKLNYDAIIFEFDGTYFGCDFGEEVYNFNAKRLIKSVEQLTKLGAF